MRNHEFRGETIGYPWGHGDDVRKAIIETLDRYEGESDDTVVKLFIVPKYKRRDECGDELMSVSVTWNDCHELWRIIRYF